ncbi:MAG: hypothetical protein LH472_02690 [Pyrinomonadaceae bacterium]|nr:hypothetical protein [Pyrinomonadaceae bacterium]
MKSAVEILNCAFKKYLLKTKFFAEVSESGSLKRIREKEVILKLADTRLKVSPFEEDSRYQRQIIADAL